MNSIYLIPLLIAMFLAINMGGSGTAPSFSAAFGANLIRRDLIPGLFGVFVFAGALIAGKKVVSTIGSGILPADMAGFTMTAIILCAVALSLFFANLLKVPQSTSQSTVAALAAPAVYFDVLNSRKVFLEIMPTWVITPIAAFIITFAVSLLFHRYKHLINIGFHGSSHQRVYKSIVILSCCYVAFAIGSNNVANATGPLLSMAQNILEVPTGSEEFMLIMVILTLVIAPCFGIGSSFLGERVLGTTGKEITSFGPLGATLISVVTATLLLLASLIRGIPASLVQMNTAAIVALAISKNGWRDVVSNTPFKKILTIWMVAPLIAAAVSLVLTVLADRLGYL